MPNNSNTHTENPTLDTEDWEIALEPYGAYPAAAVMLGFNFMALKSCLAVEPIKIRELSKVLITHLRRCFSIQTFAKSLMRCLSDSWRQANA